nr:hypothetical protein [Tanacetum cinerariifolium]
MPGSVEGQSQSRKKIKEENTSSRTKFANPTSCIESRIKTRTEVVTKSKKKYKGQSCHIVKVVKFPPTDRSDFTHEEFADELAHIISPPEYDCFYFRNLPDPGELISILNSGIRENLSTTRVNLPVEDDHSPLLAYVVWIFLAYLTYPVIPPYLHSFGKEDTIFDPGIAINRFYSFKTGLSHRCGTFKKFNTHRSHLNESLMEILLPKDFTSKSSFPQLQLGIILLHLTGSQPMLKSSYKAEDGVIISIPLCVGGVADVVVEIKGTGKGRQGSDQGACKVFGCLLGNVIEVLEVAIVHPPYRNLVPRFNWILKGYWRIDEDIWHEFHLRVSMDEMCEFGKAIDNDPVGVMSV